MPVDTHLCQPGQGASCGACCGLYNFADHSRAALTAELVRHGEALKHLPRTRDAWQRAGRTLVAEGVAAPLFQKVRVCPLLGFLDPARTKVGCLAHPMVNGGVDLRDCGVYTAEVCESFTCPSFTWLEEGEAALIRAACADLYLYGLVITDVEFVRGCFKLMQAEQARPVPPAELLANAAALEAIRALFALKERAKSEATEGGIFGRFIDRGQEEPTLRTLDYRALDVSPAPEDDVVLCLGFSPTRASELEAARALVKKYILAVVKALDA